MLDYTNEEIIEIVKDYIEYQLLECNESVEIVDIALYGSRVYGGFLPTSDLDIVVEYVGKMREDDFFNILHDEENILTIDDILVDINPIKYRSMVEFMDSVKDYRKR